MSRTPRRSKNAKQAALAPGDAVKRRTYYSRKVAGAILGVSSRQMRRWELYATAPDGPLAGSVLFVPCRPGCPWAKEPQYHAVQVELMDQALADPENLKEYEARWQTVRLALGPVTVNEALDMGIVKKGGKHVA